MGYGWWGLAEGIAGVAGKRPRTGGAGAAGNGGSASTAAAAAAAAIVNTSKSTVRLDLKKHRAHSLLESESNELAVMQAWESSLGVENNFILQQRMG